MNGFWLLYIENKFVDFNGKVCGEFNWNWLKLYFYTIYLKIPQGGGVYNQPLKTHFKVWFIKLLLGQGLLAFEFQGYPTDMYIYGKNRLILLNFTQASIGRILACD